MKQLIEAIVKPIVDYPENVKVEKEESINRIVYKLSVHPEDMGKVIGRQGKIAKAIRVLMKAYAVKENKKVNVEIIG